MNNIWQCGQRSLVFESPRVMGIINVTPDSFYEGSRTLVFEQAIATADQMLQAGASVLDIGGESTRPGAAPVSLEEERSRVIPVIRQLRKRFPNSLLSIDTRHTIIAAEAIEAGVDIINDVDACHAQKGMWELIAKHGVGYILMHSRGTPQTMESLKSYTNVVKEVMDELLMCRTNLIACGVSPQQIMLDAGFGFAKSAMDSLRLLHATRAFVAEGLYMIAASRKRFIGAICKEENATERLPGSLGAALWAADQGVQLIRVHDVRETVDALAVFKAAKEGFYA